MRKAALVLAFTLLALERAMASPYLPLIDATARKHGIDPVLLRAIVTHESAMNPWSFNADGESFRYGDKATAVKVLWSLTQAPWMVKWVLPNKKRYRLFFGSEGAARAYSHQVRTTWSLSTRTDDKKDVAPGQVRVRQLRLINTDIGIAQVNYRWNGQGVATVQTWFDPAYNLNWAAARLATLRKKHGSDIAAAGFYHSGNRATRQVYLSYFVPKYNEEKRIASASLAAAR
ncbi:lysozyme family protein [Pseudomonas guariconensis]|uniref:hypothetical protein n=1 Tax=Pseudomonas guariconensis TaxID=1288410 RepID=UPI00390638A7